MHRGEFSFFALLGQFHFRISKTPPRKKKAGIGSKVEFGLTVDGAGSASGGDEGCSESEQAEYFCDHGAGILARLVGHLRGEEIFLRINFWQFLNLAKTIKKFPATAECGHWG